MFFETGVLMFVLLTEYLIETNIEDERTGMQLNELSKMINVM